MSDTAINKIIQYGTTAQRIAFVPNPAPTSQVLYIWYDTDSAPDTYIWDGAVWVQINPAGGGTGDVVGPAGAIDDNVATFDTATGKLIQDGGKSIAGIEADAAVLAINALNGLTYLTEVDETADLANSRRVLAGTSVTFDDSVANVRTINVAPTAAQRTQTIGIVVDGGGSVLTTGLKGFKSFPVAGTITKVRLLSDVAGAIVMDIWKDTYANFPPTVADTITAAAKPTIPATNQKAEDSTLTGWTVAVAAGDVFGFNIDSVATITRILLELTIVVT